MMVPILISVALSLFTTPVIGEVSSGCTALASSFPGKVFVPGDAVYKYENAQFWSNTEIMSPLCIFRPTTTMDVSNGIKALAKEEMEFAVRGGGHMSKKGSNSIDDGVLMVLSNLSTKYVSEDHSTFTMGPAFHWGEVFEYLQGFNLSVAGGRLAPVGVPGLLLGGGINFYGNQAGFAADNVVSYQVVVASGEVLTVTAKENADLFWALKGGSSNFGIVTEFTLKTFPSKKVWAGIYSVGPDYLDEFLAAVATYSANITDPKSHIVPAIVPSTPSFSVGAVILFYDSDTESYPDCFLPFTNIPSIANTLDFKTIYEFSLETGAVVVPAINDIFVAGTVVGKTEGELLEAIQIINNTFFDALLTLYAVIPAANISIIELDWQPIGDLWLDASAANGVGGNPLGLDKNKGVYLCYAEVVEWIGSEYDDFVNEWMQNTTWAINNATKAAGFYDPFNYMGDAAGFQDIYDGYGAENKQKLLGISRKYDPKRFFQTSMPGGYKIGL